MAANLGVRYVDFIWPYTDSMLNFFQLQAWMVDFPPVLASGVLSDPVHASAAKMLESAIEAEGLDGYIYIVD